MFEVNVTNVMEGREGGKGRGPAQVWGSDLFSSTLGGYGFHVLAPAEGLGCPLGPLAIPGRTIYIGNFTTVAASVAVAVAVVTLVAGILSYGLGIYQKNINKLEKLAGLQLANFLAPAVGW